MQKYSLQNQTLYCHAWRWFCYGNHGSPFCTVDKGVSEKLHILYRGHFHTFKDRVLGADKLSPLGSCPKHDFAPPCWLCSLVGSWRPSTIHPLPHLSGFCLWAFCRGGPIEALSNTVSLWRIQHLDVGGTPEAPAASNICLLLCIRCSCLTKTFSYWAFICTNLCVLWISRKRLKVFVKYLTFSYLVQGIITIPHFFSSRVILYLLSILRNSHPVNNVEGPSSEVFP